VSVPAGFTAGGLPIGAQLLGPGNSEPRLLSLASQLEAGQRWHEHRPNNSNKPGQTGNFAQ
jgi:amidase